MQKYVVIIAILLTFTSCVTRRRCNEKFPPQISFAREDSIQYVQITKDSISYYTDSSYVRALLECDTHGQVIMKELQEYKSGKNLDIPNVIIRDNVITATCIVDSMAVYNLIKSKFSSNVKNTKENYVVTTNELTPFQKFRCNVFWPESLILLFILFLFIKNLIYGNKKR